MSTAFSHVTPLEAAQLPLGDCVELELIKAELARTLRAFLEQDERVKGSFSSFAEARRASDLAEMLGRSVGELRRRVQSHREAHGCA